MAEAHAKVGLGGPSEILEVGEMRKLKGPCSIPALSPVAFLCGSHCFNLYFCLEFHGPSVDHVLTPAEFA